MIALTENFLQAIVKQHGGVIAVNETSVLATEEELGHAIPSDYRSFLLTVGEVETPVTCFAKVSIATHEWYLPRMIATARRYGLPITFVPFCEESNDFHCLVRSGEVVFWSHHNFIVERWSSFDDWLASFTK